MTDFFDKKDDVAEADSEKVEGEEATEAEKIKIGDEEYEPEDLEGLVALGKIGRAAEKKYDTKIDGIWPDYTKKSQRLKKLEEAEEQRLEAEKQALAEKTKSGEELTEEEQIKQALSQGEKIGFVTKESVKREIAAYLEGKDLVDTCTGLEREIDGADGRPAFKTQDILAHMQKTGIRNPDKAYKDKYETEIDKWKEEQIGKARGKGMVTEESSAAGGKEPPKVKTTPENFEENVIAALRGDI